jgi:polyisoprenoid-binding protein YceI
MSAVPQEKSAALPEGEFAIDAVHSTVLFKCKHLNTSWSFGRFNDIQGSFQIDAKDPSKSRVEVTIRAESIDTGNKQRDDHLRSPDFFDVKQFPTATFTSKKVTPKGGKEFSVAGDLMIHGKTKPVTIEMEYTGSTEHPKAGRVAGFFGTLKIKRLDYGIAYMPDGLSDDVELTLSFEGKAK